jgi:hypothetical protein
MSQHTPFVKGAKLDKTKLRNEKVLLGKEHGDGVYVRVRGQSVQEAEEFEKLKDGLSDASKSEDDRKNLAYEALAICVVNDDGTQMFEDAKDVKENFDISAADFMKILEKTGELSGGNKDRSKN